MSLRYLALLTIALLLLGLSGGPVRAAISAVNQTRGGIPDHQGLIHSCFSGPAGYLRVFDPAKTRCHPGETKLVWHVGQFVAVATTVPVSATVTPSPVPVATAPPPLLQGLTSTTRTVDIPATAAQCKPTYNPYGRGTGNFCLLDSLAVPVQPISMSYVYRVDGSAGSAASGAWTEGYSGSPFLLIWSNGTLRLLAEPGVAFATTVQYDAVYPAHP